MAGSKVLQFFLLILFMIFSTHALKVLLTDGIFKNGFEYETEINVFVDEYGMRHYDGCAINKTYRARASTTKVIVYIKAQHPMLRTTLLGKYEGSRQTLSDVLRVHNFKLFYLAVYSFSRGDESLIGEFLYQSIKPHRNQTNFQINTIGANTMDMTFVTWLGNLTVYQEDKDVLGGNLRGTIENIHNEKELTHLLSDDCFDGADIDGK